MLLDRALYPAALFLFAVGFLPTAVAKPKDAILLSDVQSLTLRADKQTTHRRVPAAPQLKCVSHRSVCGLYKVDVMRCTNQGSSYGDEDIQWSCTASLPPELKLGSTEVVCEGYSSPQDPYVLKGSCGVEYRLILTDEGHKRYPDLGGGSGDGSLPAWVFWVFLTVIVVVIVYSACFANQDGYDPRGPQRRNNFWGGGGDYWGGGGGGGGGGGRFGRYDDPPPPYPGTKSSSSGEGWRPGFWSGLAGGTAAGYYAGSRGRNNNTYDGGYGSFGGRGSTWGGSGGAGPSRSDSSSSSGARYESTGFGSTSRR